MFLQACSSTMSRHSNITDPHSQSQFTMDSDEVSRHPIDFRLKSHLPIPSLSLRSFPKKKLRSPSATRCHGSRLLPYSPQTTSANASPSQQTPQRLSALYQYHNAPEVAPAHGLEYDDTIYPTSDKYPVIHTQQYEGGNYGTKRGFEGNRPPRIIFGMKVRTFLLVALVFALVIVGAAVGGAVGGKSMREGEAVGTDGSLP